MKKKVNKKKVEKSVHWAKKLKSEKSQIEAKMWQLYAIFLKIETEPQYKLSEGDNALLNWLHENRTVNHMAISRDTVHLTGSRF